MQRDGLQAASDSSWVTRMFGAGALVPVRYTVRVRDGGGEPLGTEWTVVAFQLEEALHEPYQLRLVLRACDDEPEIEALVRARVDFEIVRGERARVLHGVVLRAELLGDFGDCVRVELRVGPAVALTRLGRRCRVFQGRSVVEIVDMVLGPVLTEHASALCVDRLVRTYAPRDYCVQYRESDLDFALRILADEGITMLFDQAGEAESAVLVDGNGAFPAAGVEPLEEATSAVPELPYVPQHNEIPVESVHHVTQARRVHRARWAASIWGWKDRPPASYSTVMDGTSRPGEDWWAVDEGRPSEGLDTNGPVEDATSRRATLELRRDESCETMLSARTNATVVRVGSVFELLDPPHDEFGSTWVVTRARHEGVVPDAIVHGTNKDAEPEYRNEIECQPHGLPVAPQRVRRPRANGVHSAVVTGPEGEAIHTDRFGRIRVRMLWDEQDHEGEETSCWLRVAQPWAGDGFGTVFLPRVGTEVLVAFVDGDPDRPLCTGSVYDGGNLPPYPLPEHRARTVLRTASVSGDGYNELSFEDTAGREEVLLHAQRNLKQTIKHNQATSVGGDQRTWICGSRTTSVGRNDGLHVEGDQSRAVDGNLTERVRGAMRLHVSEAPKEPTGFTGLGVQVEQGSVDIEAKESIVLRCGACRLEIHPGKILLSGPEIVSQCPSETAAHPTSITMTERTVEVAADELRERAIEVRTDADQRVSLGVGPDGGTTSMRLDEGLTMRTREEAEIRARSLVAAGTERAGFKGSTCEIAGELISVSGKRIGIDGEGRVEIGAQGDVNVRGGKITLN